MHRAFRLARPQPCPVIRRPLAPSARALETLTRGNSSERFITRASPIHLHQPSAAKALNARLVITAQLEAQLKNAPATLSASVQDLHEQSPLDQEEESLPELIPSPVSIQPISHNKRNPNQMYLDQLDTHGQSLVIALLESLRKENLEEAWDAYHSILTTHPLGARLLMPTHLHKLAGFVAATRPPTRENFLRLLSLITQLRKLGQPIQQWEQNALVDFAGRPHRKIREEDFSSALAIASDPSLGAESTFDVVTLNTLLSIAAHTSTSSIFASALQLLQSRPEIKPDRVTYLTLLHFYARTGQINLVPGLLEGIVREGWDVGIDGLNGALWAYGRAGKLSMMLKLYEWMKQQSEREGEPPPKPRPCPLASLPASQTRSPDHISHTLVIQCLLYHGSLKVALGILYDILYQKRTRSSRYSPSDVPNMTIYRAFFLGFFKHAKPQKTASLDQLRLISSSPMQLHKLVRSKSPQQGWTFHVLGVLFSNFLALPRSSLPPSQRTLYWLLHSAWIASNKDVEVMEKVVERLVSRWGEDVIMGNHETTRVQRFLRELNAPGLDISTAIRRGSAHSNRHK